MSLSRRHRRALFAIAVIVDGNRSGRYRRIFGHRTWCGYYCGIKSQCFQWLTKNRQHSFLFLLRLPWTLLPTTASVNSHVGTPPPGYLVEKFYSYVCLCNHRRSTQNDPYTTSSNFSKVQPCIRSCSPNACDDTKQEIVSRFESSVSVLIIACNEMKVKQEFQLLKRGGNDRPYVSTTRLHGKTTCICASSWFPLQSFVLCKSQTTFA